MTLPGRRTVSVYLMRGERFLVLLNATGGLSDGLWLAPGGIVDPGEEAPDAARRELLEETGLLVASLTEINRWPWDSRGEQLEHVTFVGHAPDGSITLSDEHDGARWMSLAEYVAECVRPDHPRGPFGVERLPRLRSDLDRLAAWISGDSASRR